jgi:pantoate--beta-alanine ligase
MILAKTISDCRTHRAKLGEVALVPTMGALHAGHMRLVEVAHDHAKHVAVSLFVNPSQFGPREDFSKYPRPLEKDLELCRQAGVDLVFNPSPQEMYPHGAGVSTPLTFRTQDKTGAVAPESPPPQLELDLPQLTTVLEGRFRPGHFRGVCQVVAKLFNIIQPNVACFGQKDYQQLRILTCMVEEPDGLALSSRNQYLAPPERQRALSISRALFAAQKDFEAGTRQTNRLVSIVQNILLESSPQSRVTLLIDYVAAVDALTLKNVENITAPTVIAVAVRVGNVRLIDNVVLTPQT